MKEILDYEYVSNPFISKTQSVLVLSLMAILERMSYYGVRAVIILYAIGKDGLNLPKEDVLQYYSFFPFLLVFLFVPTGLITDKLLSQKKAIYLGGVLALIGYLALCLGGLQGTIASLIVIAIGTSFVKPNNSILIGRLFEKSDQKRSLGYIAFFTGINVGAFIGTLSIGYLAEEIGWNACFLAAAVGTLTYLMLFYFTNKKMNQPESNNVTDGSNKVILKQSLFIIIFLIIVEVLQSYSYEKVTSVVTENLTNGQDTGLFGIELFSSVIYSISTLISIPIILFFYIYWYQKGVGSTISKISKSLIFIGLGAVSIYFISYIPSNLLLEYSILPFFFAEISEIFISAFLLSHLTRVSDIKFSATIFGVFYFTTYLITRGLQLIIFDNTYLPFLAILLLTLSLIIILSKKKIVTWSFQID